MRRGNSLNEVGSVAAEFALVLPFAMLLIMAVVGMSVLATRGIALQSAAMQAARMAASFQDDAALAVLNQELPSNVFVGGVIDIRGREADPRTSNEEEGVIEARALSNGALDIFSASVVRRQSPVVPVLREGLGDRALNGGDTPSPYCRSDGGYGVCGYVR